MNEQKSAPLKAEPSPFHPPSDEAKAMLDSLIKDTYAWFVDIVAERRHLDRSQAEMFADGRIFTGRQALDAKLIDEIGGEDVALAWLGTKGVDTKLPVRDWEPARDRGLSLSLSNAALLWIIDALGISPDMIRDGVLGQILPENLRLDGLKSVWQASSSKDR